MNAEGKVDVGLSVPAYADVSIGDGKIVVKVGSKKNTTSSKNGINADIGADVSVY
ncbi:MAG TPA: hypothetical protein VJB66_05110 [Candidatus Nanoarchaeia archaeon]|nr:hypothetical protein [Candidatus Nanoarchaeia archaeon]